MTNSEAAAIIATFHGAYPNTYFDDSVAEVWANSLMVSAFQPAQKAAVRWINTMTRFPTIAEFNGEITREVGRGRDAALPTPEPEKQLTSDQRRAAFARGYERARREAGDSDDEIAFKLDRKFVEIDALVNTRADRKLTSR